MGVAATRLAAASFPLLLLLILPLAIGAAMAGHVLGAARENPAAAANSAEADGIARFAVDEHNKREVSGVAPAELPLACHFLDSFPLQRSVITPLDAMWF